MPSLTIKKTGLFPSGNNLVKLIRKGRTVKCKKMQRYQPTVTVGDDVLNTDV